MDSACSWSVGAKGEVSEVKVIYLETSERRIMKED